MKMRWSWAIAVVLYAASWLCLAACGSTSSVGDATEAPPEVAPDGDVFRDAGSSDSTSHTDHTDAGFEAGPAAPTITAVSIQGYGASRQVRTGAGVVVLEVTGTNLAPVSAVTVKDLTATVLPGATATQVAIEVTVPHGFFGPTAPPSRRPGPRALTITTPEGEATFEGAVDVTPIRVAPSGADTNVGTPESPFRTVAKAFAVAGAEPGQASFIAGDLVEIAEGAYDETAGETWPRTVPPGITVRGLGAGAVLSSTTSKNGLVVTYAEIENLSLDGFATALEVTSGECVAKKLRMTGPSALTRVRVTAPALLNLYSSDLAGGALIGISVTGRLGLQSTKVHGYSLGVGATDDAIVGIGGTSEIYDNGGGPLAGALPVAQRSGVYVDTRARLSVVGGVPDVVTVRDNYASGIYMASTKDALFENVTIARNGILAEDPTEAAFRGGLNIASGTIVKVTNVTFVGNASYGLYWSAGTPMITVSGSTFDGYPGSGPSVYGGIGIKGAHSAESDYDGTFEIKATSSFVNCIVGMAVTGSPRSVDVGGTSFTTAPTRYHITQQGIGGLFTVKNTTKFNGSAHPPQQLVGPYDASGFLIETQSRLVFE